jgi:hypothetical protein
MAKYSPAQAKKIHLVLHEFKHGKLHAGDKKGPKVTDRKRAIAIALRQAGVARK